MRATTSWRSGASPVLPHEARGVQRAVRLDFLVVGFAKCGTTTLCALLTRHPDVYLPVQKDFRLFDLPDYERRWAEYEARFGGIVAERVIGDASVWYTDAATEEHSRRQILERFPEIKLIFIARDPVDRIESAYREMHHSESKYGVECPFDLGEAIRRFPGLVEDSRYARRLDNYRRYVPAERILVLFLEELREAPDREIARCFRFIGVDPGVDIPGVGRRLNTAATKYHDTPRLRDLRREPAVSTALRRIPQDVQARLLPALGLRTRFAAGPLDWSADARRLVGSTLVEEALELLAQHGRPPGLWPRVAALRG